MTPVDVDQAIKAAGLGWGVRGNLTTAAATTADRCNVHACQSHAATANELGVTIEQFMPSLVLAAGDPLADPPIPEDHTGLRAHSAAKKQFHTLMAAAGLGWAAAGGVLVVWDAGERATEVAPRWAGESVTTQAYRAQAQAVDATDSDMVDALADLVAGDTTAFDLIMSA